MQCFTMEITCKYVIYITIVVQYHISSNIYSSPILSEARCCKGIFARPRLSGYLSVRGRDESLLKENQSITLHGRGNGCHLYCIEIRTQSDQRLPVVN